MGDQIMPEHAQLIMFKFFLKTSVPRILEERRKAEKEAVKND